MKKLLTLLFSLVCIASYAQVNTFGGIGLRVNDTTTYQTNASAYHTAGYYDIYFNNQATNNHWDVWNGSSYDHIFAFGQGDEVPAATEAVAGKAELANQAETDAGTDDERIVTPLKLNEWSKLKIVVLDSDDTNNNVSANTLENVDGLSFAVVNGGSYYFRFVVSFTSAATTTGTRWTVNGPSTSILNYNIRFDIVSGASATESRQTYNTTYDQATVSGSGPLFGTANVEGFLTATADGTVVLRFASEVSGSAVTAKAGSICLYAILN